MYVRINPFTGLGPIVYGDRFVGRVDAIRMIRERVLSENPGCLAIVGLPRIGKSSLAYQALIHERELVQQNNVIAIWIGMGTFDVADDFFRKLVLTTQDALEDLGVLSDLLRSKAASALELGCPWMEFTHRIQKFFKCVRQSGWRFVFVVDEFDDARRLFKNNLAAFQAMRELYNHPEWRIAFVTTSRRTIPEIEVYSGISTLDGIFPQLHIGLFSAEEAKTLLNPLTSIGLDLQDHDFEYIKRDIGFHPYLLATFAFHLADIWLEYDDVDIDRAMDLSDATCQTYYSRLISLLQETETLTCLMAIVAGHDHLITNTCVEKLKTYGLVSGGDGQRYFVFSRRLAGYLLKLELIVSADFLLQVGMLIGDQYRIQSTPMTTPHSQVSKAWDERLERTVAVKCLHVPSADEGLAAELRRNLLRSGQIVAQLSHPNIGAVYATLTDPVAIIMEWVEGEPLQDILNEGHYLTVPEIIRIGLKLSDALKYVHSHPEKIVHRDIKPSNIIIQENGEPKLIDFDIARARSRSTITHQEDASFSRIGTAQYSAPEQLTGSGWVGPAADIFSLGTVLYELCTHQLPYKLGNDPMPYGGQLPTPAQLTIPNSFYKTLCNLLSEEPERRLNAAQLYLELNDQLGDEPQSSR